MVTPIKFKLSDIKPAQTADIPAWLELVNLTVDGYPCLKKTEYLTKLQQYINSQQALVLGGAEKGYTLTNQKKQGAALPVRRGLQHKPSPPWFGLAV